MVRATSKAAFLDESEKGNIYDSEARVLAVIKRSSDGVLRREIAEATGMETSSVSARVNALLERGLIHENGCRKHSVTGRSSNVLFYGPAQQVAA